MHTDGNEHPSKAQWRARLLAARASVPAQQRAAEDEAFAAAVPALPGGTVCAYLSFGTEPGTAALLELLRARGDRVLLPVVPDLPGPLDWAEYTGSDQLTGSRLRGLREPAGPRAGTAAIGTAGLVLVPALAVDRHGVRLGRGAGYYDRSLPLADPAADRVALVRDAELVEQLPAQDHDVRMTAILTPGRGLVRCPV